MAEAKSSFGRHVGGDEDCIRLETLYEPFGLSSASACQQEIVDMNIFDYWCIELRRKQQCLVVEYQVVSTAGYAAEIE